MALRSLLRPALALAALFAAGAPLAGCTPPPPLAPAPAGQAYYSQQCVAGFYQCVLPAAGPIGSSCACPGLGAPSYGVIR